MKSCFERSQAEKHASKFAVEDIWSMMLNLAFTSLCRLSQDKFSLHSTVNFISWNLKDLMRTSWSTISSMTWKSYLSISLTMMQKQLLISLIQLSTYQIVSLFQQIFLKHAITCLLTEIFALKINKSTSCNFNSHI